MELGIWGSLWANCALGATFLALPTLVETPIIQQVDENTPTLSADLIIHNDHETQTAESVSESEDTDSGTQDGDGDSDQDDDTEDDTNGTEVSFVVNKDANSLLNISCDPVETDQVKQEDKADIKKKKKSYQRIRYGNSVTTTHF